MLYLEALQIFRAISLSSFKPSRLKTLFGFLILNILGKSLELPVRSEIPKIAAYSNKLKNKTRFT